MTDILDYSNDKLRAIIKRFLDIVIGFAGLVIASPVILVAAILVFAQDGRMPFYLAERLGKAGQPFRMIKLRSMYVGADNAGVDVVGGRDLRVTPLGWVLRGYKIDELPQFWNVLIGDMSLVGPRPDTPRIVAMLSPQERQVLNIKPGLTDLSSIVYSRLAELFNDSDDLEADYVVRMRPLKSALAIWYTRNWTPVMDMIICVLTLLTFIHYNLSIKGIDWLLAHYKAPLPLRESVLGVIDGKWQMRSLSEFGLDDNPFVHTQDTILDSSAYQPSSLSQ